jgi:O-antigen/teichoic acid export membrane protein
MGVIQRQSIKSSIYNYTGVVVGFIYTSLLMPHYLSEGEIGAMRLIVTYAIVLAQLASLGFNNVIIRFFPFFREDPGQKQKFFYLAFVVVTLGAMAVSVLFLLIKPLIIQSNLKDSPIFATYFHLIWPVFLFIVFFNMLDAYARSNYFSTIGSFLKEFVQRMLILAVILLIVYQLISRPVLFSLYAVALSFPTLLLVVFLIYKNEFRLIFKLPPIEPAMRKDMTRLAGYSIVTGFATLAVLQIDSIMVNQFFNEDLTGIYTINFFIGSLVIMPYRALQRIASSVVAQSFKENDLPNISKIYHKSCLTMFAIGQLILLGLWLNIENIFRILPSEYEAGKYVILLIGLANLVNMIAGISSDILATSRYYAYSAWFVGSLVVLTIVFNLIFLPLWGISGAAFASLLSMLIFAITKFIFLQRKFGFQPYNFTFLLILMMGIVTYLIVYFLPVFENLYLNVLWVSGITTLIYLAMIYFSGIIPEVNAMADRFFRGKQK